jgi:iron complex transport system ATP-binding protein
MSLTLDDVAVSIGRRRIIAEISATLPPGSCTALLGRNGAGKTTLIRGLAGLLPARGRAVLEGADLFAIPPGPRSLLVGYMAQDLSAMSARLSVLELLLLAQNSSRLAWQAREGSMQRAQELLASLRLHELAARIPAELSGGQRQMVLLALALVRSPRLLLLDEPTSALDLANQLHLLTLVRDYTRRHGIVTMLILHDLSLALRFADQVMMLESGRLLEVGDARHVMTAENIRTVYGVECQLLPVASEDYHAVCPIRPVGAYGSGPAA